MSPRSHGRLRLRSADPDAPPLIDVAHLRHPDDVSRLVEATLAARRISRADPIAQFITGQELAPGPSISDDDFDGLSTSIKARIATYHHPVGTCRMGPDPDHGAVVDAHGQVYGTDRLLVADASIMPTIPAANTNLPTIMLAERIAAWLREH
jgi:choline dehydrogenase